MVQRLGFFTGIFSIFLLVFSFVATIHVPRAAAADGPAKSVAVLPFEMHAPGSLAYLQDGLRSMLASRLAANGGAIIIEQGKIDSLLLEPGKPLQQSEAAALARQLGADYIVTGGLTSLGGAMSIDARVIAADESFDPPKLLCLSPPGKRGNRRHKPALMGYSGKGLRCHPSGSSGPNQSSPACPGSRG